MMESKFSFHLNSNLAASSIRYELFIIFQGPTNINHGNSFHLTFELVAFPCKHENKIQIDLLPSIPYIHFLWNEVLSILPVQY